VDNPIKCTACDSILVVTHQDRYQNTSEHVSNPNGHVSMKDGYQCPNPDCVANLCDVTWIEDGEMYTGARPKWITYNELRHHLEKKYGTYFAVDSWNFHYELGKQAIKRRTIDLNLYWYRLVFSPKEKGWEYEIEKRHQPDLLKWQIEVWKRGSSNHSWEHVTLIHSTLKFYNRKFNHEYTEWKRTGNQYFLYQAFFYLNGGLNSSGIRNKIISTYITLFNKGKVKEVLENHKPR